MDEAYIAIFETADETIDFLVELRVESEAAGDLVGASSCGRLLAELLGTRAAGEREIPDFEKIGRDGVQLDRLEGVRQRMLPESWAKLEAFRDEWQIRFPNFGYHAIGLMAILGSALEAELSHGTVRLKARYASAPLPWRNGAKRDSGRWFAGDTAQMLRQHLHGADRYIAGKAVLVQRRRNDGVHKINPTPSDLNGWLFDVVVDAGLTPLSASRTVWHVIADASRLK